MIAAVEKRELVTYAPGSFIKNDSKITRDFYEHVYWNDLNEWLEKNEPRLDCEFPKPNAPAAKGATLQDTSPSSDEVEEQAPVADDHDETLAGLFDPVPVEALAKMFMIDLAQWKKWQES